MALSLRSYQSLFISSISLRDCTTLAILYASNAIDALASIFPSLQIDWKTYDFQPHQKVQLPANLTELFTHPAYSVLLECLLPSLRKKYRAFPGEDEVHTYLIDSAVPGSAIQVQGYHATLIGTQEYLKTQLLQSMEWYERFGLNIEDYTISFSEGGAVLSFGKVRFSLEI